MAIIIWFLTTAGLVYVLMKHFVDRYNIFFAYAPSRINRNIHISAINFVMIACLILQLTLFFFSLLRHGLKGVTIFALVGFCATLFLVVVQASFRWFRRLAPISYRVSQPDLRMENSGMHEHNLPPPSEDVLLAVSTDTYPAGVRCLAFYYFYSLFLTLKLISKWSPINWVGYSMGGFGMKFIQIGFILFLVVGWWQE